METKLDFNKKHLIELVKVKSTYRVKYNRQGIIFEFKGSHDDFTVIRTTNIPLSLKKNTGIFKTLSDLILATKISDDLLKKPSVLAKIFEADGLGKTFWAKLEDGQNDYINLVEIEPNINGKESVIDPTITSYQND